MAQRDDPTVGYLTQLIEKDLEMLGATYKEVYKQKLKLITTSAAFSFRLNKKENLKKVKHIQYEALTIQRYLVDEQFTTVEGIILTALRSYCVRGIKHNF